MKVLSLVVVSSGSPSNLDFRALRERMQTTPHTIKAMGYRTYRIRVRRWI